MLDNSVITQFLTQYGWIGLFLGSFFLGESVIITAAFLAFHKILTMQEVFFFTFLGTILSDSLWFLFGRRIIRLFRSLRKSAEHDEKYIKKINEITGEKAFLTLLYIKFLYGTRILTILYLGARHIPFLKFTFYNICGTIIWLTVVLSVAWLAASQAAALYPQFHHVEYALSLIFLLILLFKLASSWITRRLLNKK